MIVSNASMVGAGLANPLCARGWCLWVYLRSWWYCLDLVLFWSLCSDWLFRWSTKN